MRTDIDGEEFLGYCFKCRSMSLIGNPKKETIPTKRGPVVVVKGKCLWFDCGQKISTILGKGKAEDAAPTEAPRPRPIEAPALEFDRGYE